MFVRTLFFFFWISSLSCLAGQVAIAERDTTMLLPMDIVVRQKKEGWLQRVIATLGEMDTTYIAPNYYNYAAMLQNSNFYQSYTLAAEREDKQMQSLTVVPRSRQKIGPYFGWRWIFLGYTFDVARPKTRGRTTEFSLSLYSGKLGLDYIAIRSTGDFMFQRVNGFEGVATNQLRGKHFVGMDAVTKRLNIYYIFNSTRFSYPAAFNQSTVQRRSAGSWSIGLRFARQKVNLREEHFPNELRENMTKQLSRFQVDQRSYHFSLGYSYNWVFAKNWILAASISPAIGYTYSKGDTFHNRSLLHNLRYSLTNLDNLTRVGVVYNNNRWFVGASAIHYLYNYRQAQHGFYNSVLYANFYVGFNFHKRKQYR